MKWVEVHTTEKHNFSEILFVPVSEYELMIDISLAFTFGVF